MTVESRGCHSRVAQDSSFFATNFHTVDLREPRMMAAEETAVSKNSERSYNNKLSVKRFHGHRRISRQ